MLQRQSSQYIEVKYEDQTITYKDMIMAIEIIVKATTAEDSSNLDNR